MEQRRQADLPHKSFDLDGDGHVSVTDFFWAKKFDQDKDGKLNSEEKETANQALSTKGFKE